MIALMAARPDKTMDKLYELYLEERRYLIAATRDTATSFDKAILTLASGAFGISLLFLKDIAPNPYPNTRWLLGSSWLSFSLTLLTIVIGFMASQKACARQIDVCEAELLRNEKIANKWVTLASVCNSAAIILLALAFMFSGLFVYWNYIHVGG